MSLALDLREISQFWTIGIVDSVIVGTVMAVFAGIAAISARRQSSGTKFALWFCGLVGITALPMARHLFWPSAATSAATGRALFQIPEAWAFYIFGAWAITSAWLLFRIVVGLRHLQKVRRSCRLIDLGDLDPLLQSILEQAQEHRRVLLGISSHVRVPTAIGLGHPLIVMPEWVMRELTPPEMRQVLLHELAHIRRHDDWTNLFQQIVKAVFFFHPAVWWIDKHLALEREMACDDAVLAETEDPRSYAECLGRLAETSFLRRGVALAQAILGRVKHTSRRIAQILSSDRPVRKAGVWKPAIAVMVGFAVVCGACISRWPQWVAFQDSQQSRVAAPSSKIRSTATVTAVENLVRTSANATTLVIPAKSEISSEQPRIHHADIKSARPKRSANLVHLSSDKSAVPIVRTFFVVIQDGPSQAPVYQIQMWRLLILKQKVDEKTPQKQI